MYSAVPAQNEPSVVRILRRYLLPRFSLNLVLTGFISHFIYPTHSYPSSITMRPNLSSPTPRICEPRKVCSTSSIGSIGREGFSVFYSHNPIHSYPSVIPLPPNPSPPTRRNCERRKRVLLASKCSRKKCCGRIAKKTISRA